ncbi:MAG TPA: PilZ domain-containing protein [Vicinamibacterales bacterium]
MTLRPHQVPRATRFAIPITIFYRTPGDASWQEGWTENISKSGVLFRADREIKLDTPVEMLLDIPAFIATPVAGTALCRGRIVRAERPSADEDRPAFAARIFECEPARPSDPRRI